MAKRWNRIETWVVLIVLGIGLVITAVGGLWVYVSATAPVLHPSAQGVRSVADATPVQQWAGAIEHGRQVVRATLAEQNWPGLSVAVGAGGAIVWAAGFGWANLDNQVPVSPATQFRIGTMSTVLTSAAIGLLLEKDRLKLDEKLQTYLNSRSSSGR